HAVSSPGSLPPIRWAARSPGLAPARCAASAEITSFYDERPRLPVGLAIGAADQGPRACHSARGLTGRERDLRFRGPGTERCYGAGGEEMATSSLDVTDGVPRCPSRTTPAC